MGKLPESFSEGGNLRDTRLIARAIKQRWPIPEQYREALIARQVLIATGRIEDATPREQTTAFQALLAAEVQNQNDEHQEHGSRGTVEHHHIHDIGPVTEANFVDAKRQLVARIGRAG